MKSNSFSFNPAIDPDLLECKVKKVSVLKKSTKKVSISKEKIAGCLSRDFTLASNLLGCWTARALKYIGINKNPANKSRMRIAILEQQRILLAGDRQRKWTVKCSEGERKGWPTPIIGQTFGLGSHKIDTVLGLLEMDEGLVDEKKMRTLVAAVFAEGEKGGILELPDMYMFKIVTCPGTEKIKLDMILNEMIEEGDMAEFYSRLIPRLLAELEKELGISPGEIKAAVLFRERHAGLIQALIDAGIRVKVTGFKEMERKLKESEGRFINGNLILSEDDDWSAGLEMGLEGGPHLIIGSGGTPATIKSNTLVKKSGGSFTGFLVSYESMKGEGDLRKIWQFSRKEERLLSGMERPIVRPARLKEYKNEEKEAYAWDHIFTAQELVRSQSLDIACVIGVVRDYTLGERLIPGPEINCETGRLICHVLWVDEGGTVLDIELEYTTSINSLIAQIKKTQDSHRRGELSYRLSMVYSKFGCYEEAQRVLSSALERVENIRNSQEKKDLEAKIKAAQHYIEGLRILVEEPMVEEPLEKNPNILAIEESKMALGILKEHKLKDPGLNRGIRRRYTFLRDWAFKKAMEAVETERERYLEMAYKFSDKAIGFSDEDLETLLRDLSLRMYEIAEGYERRLDYLWKNERREPELNEAMLFALQAYSENKDSQVLQAYRKLIEKHISKEEEAVGRGDIFIALGLQTFLKEMSLSKQARIIKVLYEYKEKRKIVDLIKFFELEERDIEIIINALADSIEEKVRKMEKKGELGELKVGLESADFTEVPTTQTYARQLNELAHGLSVDIENRKYAQQIWSGLAELSHAQAILLFGLGHRRGAKNRLNEAVSYYKRLITDWEIGGIYPTIGLLEIFKLYILMYEEFDNEDDGREAIHLYYALSSLVDLKTIDEERLPEREMKDSLRAYMPSEENRPALSTLSPEEWLESQIEIMQGVPSFLIEKVLSEYKERVLVVKQKCQLTTQVV
ncbi:MAG: fructose-bisphosphatase class II [bacterium]